MLRMKRGDMESIPNKWNLMSRIGAVLAVGFYLFTWAPNSFPDDDEHEGAEDFTTENLIAIHDRDSPQYDDESCLDCHVAVLTGESLNPSIARAHVAMIPFAPGEDDADTCVFCHRTVDLVQGTPRPQGKSGGNLRKHVDSAVCTLCHGPSNPDPEQQRPGQGQQFYAVGLSSLGLDGDDLYDLVCAGCHRDLADSQVKDEDAAEITEAIEKDKGGMGPLSALFPEEIQAIADALAQAGGGDDEEDDEVDD